MGYAIWGQSDEENQAHDDSYSVVEAVGTPGDSPKDAIEKLIMGYVEQSVKTGTDLGEILPAPANGDHWHFKVVDEADQSSHEFVVRFQLLPALQVAEMEPVPKGDSADGGVEAL